MDAYRQASEDALKECLRAREAYPPFHSAHEGFAVIAEELDELWDEVKLKQSKRSAASLRREATQIAAMALRFMVEVDGTS